MTLRTLMQAGPAKANELFAKLSETSEGALKTREKLFAELKAELEFHAKLEEQHLFPVLRRNAETKDLVADAMRDNKDLRSKLAELDGMPKNDAAFLERLSELQKVFRQHTRDDRKELLPAVRRALSEEQVQGVTERMAAGVAEAEQARQDEAEERRTKARQEREQAEWREQEEADAAREQAATEQLARARAQQLAEMALQPLAATTNLVKEAARQTTSVLTAEPGRPPLGGLALTNMFMWPWIAAMQSARQADATSPRGVSGTEEVIQLGEEVLEVGKRTVSRGTARIRRFVVEVPIERQVTLHSERVVVERRRPVTDQTTGEILTEVTIEVVETEEVPTIEKRLRLREEVVVRTERTQRVETVKEVLRRDEVDIQQPRRGRRSPAASAEGEVRARGNDVPSQQQRAASDTDPDQQDEGSDRSGAVPLRQRRTP